MERHEIVGLLFKFITLFEHDPHIIKHIQIPKFNSDHSGNAFKYRLFFSIESRKNNPNETSLFDIFNQTCTLWENDYYTIIIHPITDSEELNRRYSLIEKSDIKRNREMLSNILDIEKI